MSWKEKLSGGGKSGDEVQILGVGFFFMSGFDSARTSTGLEGAVDEEESCADPVMMVLPLTEARRSAAWCARLESFGLTFAQGLWAFREEAVWTSLRVISGSFLVVEVAVAPLADVFMATSCASVTAPPCMMPLPAE